MPIIFLLLFLLSCTSSVLSTKDDETMLLKMKKQLGNPDMLRKWVKGFEYCGIRFYKPPNSLVYTACTSTGRVSNLRIKNLHFSAPFPDAICGLTELDSLEIYNWPALHGPIPSCIHKLVNLRSLVITQTSLSDSLPSFSKNTNLTGITLSSNHLSGTIPPSLSKLPNLSFLDLSSNYITGTIPPKIVRGHSPTLFLSNNNLTGEIPKSYKSVDFKMINLGDNQLSGDASFLFGKQKTAIKIVLANNDFEFDLSFVKFSKKLYKLDLSHNKIYGNVPDSFARATRLQDPNLSFNRLCGELPKGGNMWRFNAAVFANNTCLCGNPLPPCFNLVPTSAPAPAPVSTTQFHSAPAPAPISTTQFDSAPAPSPVSTTQFDSAPAPAPVSTTLFESAPPPDSRSDENILLKMKEQLGNPDIFRNWVKGFDYCGIGFTHGQDSVVVVFCTDTGRVFNLRIRSLDVTAPFPDAICEFTEVETIEIYHFPGLHGPIPSCISELVNLRSLVITETSLSGSVPNFSNNTNLLGITLSRNQLSGTIPTSLSTLPKLNFLDLGSNYLTGTIPPGLVPGDSPMLFLSNNNLTGEIPKSYGSINFFMIHVGNNKLSGDASFLFGKQKTAVNMDLANNDFEFDLSSVELSDRLYKLDLSHNKIYGKVPDSFASATSLGDLNLSFNRLCGELPKGGNMWRFNAAVFANNTCLCGNPLPPCFNAAPTSAPAPAPVSTTLFDSTPAPAPVSTSLFDSAPAPAPISTTLFESAPAPTPAPAMAPDSNSVIDPSPRDTNDEILLLQMKKQLGDPDILSNWVTGFEYCGIGFSRPSSTGVVIISCTSTGRVFNLRFKDLDISAPFPDAICGFTELDSLEIYNWPGLHGPIPSCINELVNLRFLVITGTSLSGSVPSFSNNTNLNAIFLTGNHLCGNPLPPCFNSAPAPAPESTTP